MLLRSLTFLPRLRVSAPQPCVVCKSKMSGSSGQIFPRFIYLEDGGDITRCYKFRLVSYNILAQVYVKSSNFPGSPSSCLKWKIRSQAILTALKSFNADFLCIQELDEYDSFYKSNLESTGYSGIYIQRNGQKRDGCGIFYKPNCAKLVSMEEIYYNDLANSLNLESTDTSEREFSDKDNHSDHGDLNDPRIRLKRDCVGLLAAFKLNDPSHHLVIMANTHIYWDPELIDVKLAQVKYLLLRVAQFKEAVSDKYGCSPSVIIAGDFNSTPGDKVYEYMISASTIQLHSLYGCNGGEPPFTNCTTGFTGTLDYIFISNTNSLKPISLLQLPGPGSPDVIGGLPNHQHPSDHLPIGGDFEVLSYSNCSTSKPLEEPLPEINKLKLDNGQ
ncbi:carbon catabolite repressor protein 4 homolog 4-like isoform X2 [Dioscorea cayenensis subsp. rotundata]|uniref:Carbon catabolite repressor protein 4 homolog 4-like isoform X2 n=1 Tax=Dioscorea cayennensis subsp. rotundata TaxID=55577 RepID=A0AB40B3X9_DIOCR|nr:carbon catabolite repressor protein 4 homolog 4-like isoform X2 [Dioscorea cayenensis subsp. rotundata]